MHAQGHWQGPGQWVEAAIGTLGQQQQQLVSGDSENWSGQFSMSIHKSLFRSLLDTQTPAVNLEDRGIRHRQGRSQIALGNAQKAPKVSAGAMHGIETCSPPCMPAISASLRRSSRPCWIAVATELEQPPGPTPPRDCQHCGSRRRLRQHLNEGDRGLWPLLPVQPWPAPRSLTAGLIPPCSPVYPPPPSLTPTTTNPPSRATALASRVSTSTTTITSDPAQVKPAAAVRKPLR